MSDIEIVWRDPPPKLTRSAWAERLAPLRERPGTWAMVRQGEPRKISGLKQRLSRTVALKDAFEFQTHKVSDDRAELYARYVATA